MSLFFTNEKVVNKYSVNGLTYGWSSSLIPTVGVQFDKERVEIYDKQIVKKNGCLI